MLKIQRKVPKKGLGLGWASFNKTGPILYRHIEFVAVRKNKKALTRRASITFKMHVHYTCISLSYLGRCCVHSIRISYWFLCSCPVTVLPNLVELGGFEPPSEITTPSALHA